MDNISLAGAAKCYLDKLRRDLGDKKMYKILSAQKYLTLIFAIDTTGSMREKSALPKQSQKELLVQHLNQKLIIFCHRLMIQVRFTFLQESLTILGRIFGPSNQTETNILNLYYNFIISFYGKLRKHFISTMTAQKLKFSITDLFSKCDQTGRELVTLFCRR